MDKKVTKVIYEYEDGSSQYLKDEEAHDWSESVNGLCIFAYIHNCNPDWTKFKWVKIDNKKKDILY